jgi:DNA-binding transcriptional ArsR family regulator
VSELARGLPVSRPAVSQHLRILKEARLVIDRAAGTRRLYSLNPQGLDSLREYIDQMWSSALAEFKIAAEGKEEE